MSLFTGDIYPLKFVNFVTQPFSTNSFTFETILSLAFILDFDFLVTESLLNF